MDKHAQKLIFKLIDETIADDEYAQLLQMLERSSEVRWQYLRAINLGEAIQQTSEQNPPAKHASSPEVAPPLKPNSNWTWQWQQLAIVASLLIAVTGVAYWIGTVSSASALLPSSGDESSERQLAGHATLRRTVDVRWSKSSAEWHDGEVLPRGEISIDSGIAEIDFFCGASLIVEGPARLNIDSDWAVQVAMGRLRATVPPAARGFVVRTSDTEIVDLGTEFALEVERGAARVEVIDGEIELRGGKFSGKHLFTGEGESLLGEHRGKQFVGLSTSADLQSKRFDAQQKRLKRWEKHAQTIASDPRVIAHYATAIDQTETKLSPTAVEVGKRDRRIRNRSLSGSAFDGLMVGPVASTRGRFGGPNAGLDFERPGSRVRTRIDGNFRAFTFACWVRIDSLPNRYNALFMGDGYENGEPHWQIRDDGCLMFSVMVDDSQDIRTFNKREQQMVDQAGLHRVYYSKPIWNVKNAGQWFHLAATYDPANRIVCHFVNGRRVSSAAITDRFFTNELQIGPAEIGNWGQPFRKSPWFAVRNLNGTMDELVVYQDALPAEEINELFELGKPLGY